VIVCVLDDNINTSLVSKRCRNSNCNNIIEYNHNISWYNGRGGRKLKPAEKRSLSAYSNITAYNSSLCPVCGGDHNVLVISLENDGHIITSPFQKEKATEVKAKVTGVKRRATRLDMVDAFCPYEEGEI
jgi:hypothetical protein